MSAMILHFFLTILWCLLSQARCLDSPIYRYVQVSNNSIFILRECVVLRDYVVAKGSKE